MIKVEFKEKNVIITGPTGGIGKGMTERFAREGASVIVVGRNEEKGRAVAKKIVDSGGGAHYIKNDVSREEDVNNMMDKTVEGYGQKVSIQRRLCIL